MEKWSHGLSDEELLRRYDDTIWAQEDGFRHKSLLEQEIIRRCRERGALGIADYVFDCHIEDKVQYEQARLLPLLEMLSAEEVELAFEPPSEKVTHLAARWNIEKLLPIARLRGGEVKAMVEGARVITGVRVKFGRKGHTTVGGSGGNDFWEAK